MDKLILKDGTIICAEAGASLSSIRVKSETKEEMLATWEKLTRENLSEVEVKTEDDLTVAHYKDLVLVSETSVVAEDGAVETSYYLREKDGVEKRLDALEESQKVQDDGIAELGEFVSDIVEGE